MKDKSNNFIEKREVKDLPIENLHLDPKNPRLPEEVQGKPESDILEALYRDFDLEELAYSITENGYFAEEPIVVVDESQKNKPKFTVVEGNRRIATIKILLSTDLQKKLGVRSWPEVSKRIKDHLQEIPAIVYPSRTKMLPYLGVRHIAGIKKWESYAKARYVANMVDEGYSIDEIQKQIGDRQNSARKHYLCYKLAEQAKDEFDVDIGPIRNDFSFLMLATGQGNVKRYLGIPVKLSQINFNKPIPKSKISNLKNLLSWLYGDKEGKSPVIRESRDITNYLSHVLASKTSTEELLRSRDLISAYELSDGEENLVLKKLGRTNRDIEFILGIAHRHKTADVIAEVERCYESISRLINVVKGKRENV